MDDCDGLSGIRMDGSVSERCGRIVHTTLARGLHNGIADIRI